jgi:glycosyltransferase involved in cell wall biosynthesis
MGTIFALVAKAYRKPIFFLIPGYKKRSIAENIEQGITRSIALISASALSYLTRFMTVHNAVSFIVGNELLKLYERGNNHVYKITPLSYLTFTRLIAKSQPVSDEAINTVHPDHPVTRLLYVGNLYRLKGVEYLIKAVKIVKQKHNIQLDIVGDGNDEERLKEMVDNEELTPCVNFLGHIPHSQALIRLYRSSDIFVLPSLTEGVPSVVLEAMTLGLPVIATSVGSVPYIISHEENGLLVSPRNPDEIADNITRLIENPSLREKIVGNALRYVESLPSFYEQRDEMVRILSSQFNLPININCKEGKKHG